MTDYKKLCADLVAWAEKTSAHYYSEPGVLIQARAALAEPEPEWPTDEEIMEVMPQQMRDDLAAAARALAGFDPDNIKAASVFRIILNRHFVDHSRAVLARWGNHPALQPISVSERLPGPEDCDREGNVWAWRRFDPENGIDNGDFWCLASCEWLGDEDSGFTHWLPAHALPGPQPVLMSERLQQVEDLAADAIGALRYIEQVHGRLYGVGWDRVYEKADRLLPAHALPVPSHD
jgi:hypothetical protein